MVSSPKWFTCAELAPYLLPYFSFLSGKQGFSSSSSQRVCLISQKTFGTLHKHIGCSISTNLCILPGRAAGFCRLVRAAEKVKRTPHNSVYFARVRPIKDLHFCRFDKAHVRFF